MKIKLLNEKATIPARATDGSAGYDLCACINVPETIKIGEIKKIPTGIAVAVPSETAVMIYARSGLACSHGVCLANGVGVVDSDYRGEIIVALINLGDEDFVIEPQMRIAQMVVTPILTPKMIPVDVLPVTARGSGGFGSTGVF